MNMNTRTIPKQFHKSKFLVCLKFYPNSETITVIHCYSHYFKYFFTIALMRNEHFTSIEFNLKVSFCILKNYFLRNIRIASNKNMLHFFVSHSSGSKSCNGFEKLIWWRDRANATSYRNICICTGKI